MAQLPFSLTNIRSGDRFGFRINKPGWIEMIKNGKSYPPIPLKLSNRISIGIEFEVTPEDEISISGWVRNFVKKWYRSKHTFKLKSCFFDCSLNRTLYFKDMLWPVCSKNFVIFENFWTFFSCTKMAYWPELTWVWKKWLFNDVIVFVNTRK